METKYNPPNPDYWISDMCSKTLEGCRKRWGLQGGVNIGETEDNLKAAVAGETYEYTEMYPGFAATAREEGFDDIAEWFETLARAEKSHAGKFQETLDSL